MILKYMDNNFYNSDIEQILVDELTKSIDKTIIYKIRMTGLKAKLHKNRLVKNRNIKIKRILD